MPNPHDARTTANSDKKPAETLNPAAEITASISRSAEIEGRVIEDTYIRHMHDTAGKLPSSLQHGSDYIHESTCTYWYFGKHNSIG
jgi:hypothetical protein